MCRQAVWSHAATGLAAEELAQIRIDMFDSKCYMLNHDAHRMCMELWICLQVGMISREPSMPPCACNKASIWATECEQCICRCAGVAKKSGGRGKKKMDISSFPQVLPSVPSCFVPYSQSFMHLCW